MTGFQASKKTNLPFWPLRTRRLQGIVSIPSPSLLKGDLLISVLRMISLGNILIVTIIQY